jgi:hypothetical protein
MEAAHDLNHLVQIKHLTIPKSNAKEFTGDPALDRQIHRKWELLQPHAGINRLFASHKNRLGKIP